MAKFSFPVGIKVVDVTTPLERLKVPIGDLEPTTWVKLWERWQWVTRETRTEGAPGGQVMVVDTLGVVSWVARDLLVDWECVRLRATIELHQPYRTYTEQEAKAYEIERKCLVAQEGGDDGNA